jgi:cytochrome d ubiquinol oxidase subunit II
MFALSSLLTPFFLGAVAGAVASGRVPAGNAAGHPIGSWVSPTSVLTGAFAVAVCAYLAAVYLTGDARRQGAGRLAERFRTRAIWSGAVTGILAAAGIAVVRADAPLLFEGMTGRALPLVPLSMLGGVATMWLMWQRRFVAARVAAAVAVVGVLWGWGAAQYPYLLEGTVTISDAAASAPTLRAMLVSLSVGGVLVVPGLVWLFVLFQRGDDGAPRHPAAVASDRTPQDHPQNPARG